MRNPNLDLLQLGATKLKALLPDIVFVGGCVTALLITDSGSADVRKTEDVDVIAQIASYPDYVVVWGERLRALGFEEDTRPGAPTCRWLQGNLMVDVMPLQSGIIGPSNRWYPDGLKHSVWTQMPNGENIRHIPAPYFLATKFEAFRGRGKGDFFASHDLEYLISVIDGRSSIVDEVRLCSQDLRSYLRKEVLALLAEPRFLDALPGFLSPDVANQGRFGSLEARLREFASL